MGSSDFHLMLDPSDGRCHDDRHFFPLLLIKIIQISIHSIPGAVTFITRGPTTGTLRQSCFYTSLYFLLLFGGGAPMCNGRSCLSQQKRVAKDRWGFLNEIVQERGEI